ncbi:glycosyltransferase family 2 protein [Candidatus Thioglobus sp.]|nr:glycosyltransferase family 2 protein [Candidatus Thioglobus sp.]
MINKISVTILTKNSERYIEECLDALREFDEIVVLDNGSTDSTMDLAKNYPNVRIFEYDFIGFGPLKNLAAEKAKNDWILSVDSDEILSSQLVNEILNKPLEDNVVYSMRRDNFYNGKLVNCCGWGNDWVNRLFNRAITCFNDKQVHESLEVKQVKVKQLNETFRHYSFDNASELLQKMDKYSSLWAYDNQDRYSSTLLAVVKSTFAFIKFYLIKGGIFAGYRGFLISFSNAAGVLYKYMKLYEQKNKM